VPLAPGRYRAEFWETYNGLKMSRAKIVVVEGEDEGVARIEVPAFWRDVAITFVRAESGESR
jgi:hypothetical protein